MELPSRTATGLACGVMGGSSLWGSTGVQSGAGGPSGSGHIPHAADSEATQAQGPLRPAHPGAECPLPRQSPEAPVLGGQAQMAGAAVPGTRPPPLALVQTPPRMWGAHTRGLSGPSGFCIHGSHQPPSPPQPTLHSLTLRPSLSFSQPLPRPSAAGQGPREGVGGGGVRGPRGGPWGQCPWGDLLGPSRVPALPHGPSTLMAETMSRPESIASTRPRPAGGAGKRPGAARIWEPHPAPLSCAGRGGARVRACPVGELPPAPRLL